MRLLYTLYIALFAALTAPVVVQGATEFLQPEEAFKLSASADANGIKLRWQVADGYYVYRQRLAETPR